MALFSDTKCWLIDDMRVCLQIESFGYTLQCIFYFCSCFLIYLQKSI